MTLEARNLVAGYGDKSILDKVSFTLNDGEILAFFGHNGAGKSTTLKAVIGLIPVQEVHYLQATEKYVLVHHEQGEDLIEDSLKSLEEEFSGRFLRIHRNCLVARDRLAGLRRSRDGNTQVVLRDQGLVLDASRRALPGLRDVLRQL